jgi:hypothetical protein
MDTRYLLMLETKVFDMGREIPGPHIAGWVQRTSPDALTVRILDTVRGKTARALIDEELLDAVVGSDGRVRLTDGPAPPVTVRFSDLRARGIVS